MTTKRPRAVGSGARSAANLPTKRLEMTMTKYACPDCDATFDAPTDTETVRCPGCGDMVGQQAAEEPDRA